MQKLISDINNDTTETLDTKTAEKFLFLLFEELKTPISRQEIHEIISACLSDENTFSIETFKILLTKTIPASKLQFGKETLFIYLLF